MRNIQLALSPLLLNSNIEDNLVVVIDILRASTIICTMFSKGLKKLIPVQTLDEARQYKEKGFLIAAERDGKKIDFADFGNTPEMFSESNIKNKTIVYSTTNGTNTIYSAKNAKQVVIGSFLNLDAVIKCINESDEDILLLCSGWQGDFCIEDTLFAGALIHNLLQSRQHKLVGDAPIMALDLWELAKQNLMEYIKRTFQWKRLSSLGLEDVIDYCFRVNITSVLPALENEYLIDLNKNNK